MTAPMHHDGTLPARQHAHPVSQDEPNPLAVADELGITDEYLLVTLQDVVRRALAGSPIYTREGEHIDDVPHLGTATRALELLMKHRGLLTERTETNVTGGIDIRIIGVNTDQLT